MLNLTPKTLSPSSFLFNPIPIPQNPNPKFLTQSRLSFKSEYQTERGHEFETDESFFREESATGRDLSVLAASLSKKSKSKLRVLDALYSCGIQSLQFLVKAEADFMLTNDTNEEYRRTNLVLKGVSERVKEDG
ncbi:hypothetical protein CFP56_037238 [Quercus suber]|uniref:Uncharacterized protein n=1 Tax=Quercus suber TaxID=58331 RepID=A0AAW0J5D2_QUESU|nr:hypothetical protein CFP56_78075 [Quercus suber]